MEFLYYANKKSYDASFLLLLFVAISLHAATTQMKSTTIFGKREDNAKKTPPFFSLQKHSKLWHSFAYSSRF